MTTHPVNPVIRAATEAQNRAADPKRSIWVSANAGTGKTRVLTSRILRLLLDGAKVTDILAVTYTRAAASEMRNRLFEKLARWTVMSGSALEQELNAIGIDRPSLEQRDRARRLFATLLDQPVGIRIETVHAFAQSVLRRFPIEAGLQPWFEIATNAQAAGIKKETVAAVLHSRDALVVDALAELARHFGERVLMDKINKLIRYPQALAALRENPAAFKRRLFDAFGAGDDADDPDAARIRLTGSAMPDDQADLRRVAAALTGGGTNDKKRARKILDWLDADDDRRSAGWEDYCSAYITGKGTIADNLASVATLKDCPDADEILRREADKVRAIAQQLHGLDTAALQYPLMVVAEAMAREYGQAKTNAGLLEYDDLIDRTIMLLNAEGGVSWVRYKLDRGINYLLIDEAQDTSPQQWKILSSLADEFFSGDEEADDNAPPRSLFSVGDFKQSIYRFQGADPELFLEKEENFSNRASIAHKEFERVDLNASFRSAEPVLGLVDAIAADDLKGIGDATSHAISRQGQGGFVEILGHIKGDPASKPDAFVSARMDMDSGDPSLALARKIVATIQSWIGSRWLPARGRRVRAGDILILIRKRAGFKTILDRELRLAGLPVAGADRIKLNDDIAIMDLLALGRVMLLPDDDLTLATVLKSPLFGLDEDHLFRLAHDRGKASLFSRLSQMAGDDAMIGAAHDRFVQWLGLAEALTPYAFFRRVLDGDVRKAFAHRLGNHVRDALAEFLEVARQHESLFPATMTGFLHFMEESDAEVTRESSNRGDDEIRIMTVHGAKGLEAPIVILPDTLKARTGQDSLIDLDPDGVGLPVFPAGNHPVRHPVFRAALDDRRQRDAEEEDRLFYVALTRAEDGLLVAGFEARYQRSMAGSWYEKVSTAMNQLGAVSLKDDDGHPFRRLENKQTAEPEDEKPRSAGVQPVDLPEWVNTMAAQEKTPPRPLSPSRFGAVPAVSSPVGQDRRDAMQRGSLAHRMLEILPGLEGEARRRTAERLVASAYSYPLDEDTARAVLGEVETLMETPALAPLFGEAGRAEVPVSGMVGGIVISGVIDRLLVTDVKITIVDFKTGTPPGPGQPLPEAYTRQLALYSGLMQQIWPGRAVEAGVVFTEDASIHWADRADMDTVLAGMADPS